MDTLKILEHIEALVEESWNFAGFRRFDEDEFFMLISKLRASLPEDMRKAGKIAQNSERIVEAAQSEADQAVEAGRAEAAQIVQEARAQAKSLVEQSEIARIATAQAKEIVAQAEAEAREVRSGADEYARDVLLNLENQVGDVLSQVEGRVSTMLSTIQRGRQKLEARTSRGSAADVRTVVGRAADRREPIEVGGSAGHGTANGRA